jgi:subfamily B ATP-binding cassette protein MsbA
MKGYWKFIKFTFKYKYYALMNILCNILSSIFGLFSIATIMPILEVLFSTQQGPKTIRTVKVGFSFNKYFDLLKDNIWEYKNLYGSERVLLFICVFVVLMITLKNLFRYLALFFMVPMRNYIVSDYRVAAYNRILVLPLSYFNYYSTIH